jgi:uncharacterized protein (DUF1501 family)
MAITRRQFLKRTGAVAAGSLLGPSLFSNPFVRRALADTIGDRYFVVVYHDGGNDGLNTVTPATNGGGGLRTAYDVARLTGGGGLNLLPGALASTLIGNDPNTGAQLALHPGLTGLKQLYDLGKVAVVQGCGYPDYSLSHEQSRSIWQTADPLGLGLGSGWVGRYLAANYGGTDIPGVNISDSIVGEFRQGATSVLTLDRVREFGFPYDDYYNLAGDNALKRTAFLDLCTAASGNAQSTVKYIGDSGAATLLSSESYPALDDLYESNRGAIWDPQYDAVERSLANDLREVAKVIYGVSQGASNVTARFFQVSNGGYDTHADQGGAQTDGQHYSLHREVGDSINVFYQDLADMGLANKVCLVLWSEFSRRVPQNDSGTDHGSQGPMFVIGGAVNGGVYGNHPNIDDLALDGEGNTEYRQGGTSFRSTDFRDVYGTILKHWLNMPAGSISTVLPADTGDANFYWTAPNFDLGFL